MHCQIRLKVFIQIIINFHHLYGGYQPLRRFEKRSGYCLLNEKLLEIQKSNIIKSQSKEFQAIQDGGIKKTKTTNPTII